MSKVLVIGAGGVSSVAVHKMAMNADVFSAIFLASRTKSKCDAIAASVEERTGVAISTYQLDADDVAATTQLVQSLGVELVVGVGRVGGLGVDGGLGHLVDLGGGHGLSFLGGLGGGHCATWVISNAAGCCAACGCSGPA